MIKLISCATCRHFGLEESKKRGKPVCAAFPNGIPEQIHTGGHSHKTPYPDDRGIQYQLRDGLAERLDELGIKPSGFIKG